MTRRNPVRPHGTECATFHSYEKIFLRRIPLVSAYVLRSQNIIPMKNPYRARARTHTHTWLRQIDSELRYLLSVERPDRTIVFIRYLLLSSSRPAINLFGIDRAKKTRILNCVRCRRFTSIRHANEETYDGNKMTYYWPHYPGKLCAMPSPMAHHSIAEHRRRQWKRNVE